MIVVVLLVTGDDGGADAPTAGTETVPVAPVPPPPGPEPAAPPRGPGPGPEPAAPLTGADDVPAEALCTDPPVALDDGNALEIVVCWSSHANLDLRVQRPSGGVVSRDQPGLGLERWHESQQPEDCSVASPSGNEVVTFTPEQADPGEYVISVVPRPRHCDEPSRPEPLVLHVVLPDVGYARFEHDLAPLDGQPVSDAQQLIRVDYPSGQVYDLRPDDATPAPAPDPAEPSNGDGEPTAGTNGAGPSPDIDAFCAAIFDAAAVVSDGGMAEAHRERDAVALRELHLARLARLEVAYRSAPPDLSDDLRVIVEFSSAYAEIMDARDAWGADSLDQYQIVEDSLGQDARQRENQAWGNLDLRLHEYCPQ